MFIPVKPATHSAANLPPVPVNLPSIPIHSCHPLQSDLARDGGNCEEPFSPRTTHPYFAVNTDEPILVKFWYRNASR